MIPTHTPARPDAELLKRLRKHLNLTQSDLASLAKVSSKVVAALETGYLSTPTLSTLNSVARALNIRTTQLLIEETQNPGNFELAQRLKAGAAE